MASVSVLPGVPAARADVETLGELREASDKFTKSPKEVIPFVSTENEDYECTAKYSDIQAGAFTWVIGSCPKGSTLEAVVRRLHSDSEPEGDYALGGWVGSAFQGCGWIEEDKFKPKAEKRKPTTACSEIASGKYEVAEALFMNKHNSGAGDGYFVVNKVPCPEYANYRPWSSSNIEQENLRTQPAYASSGGNVPALKWRYTTKYNSTDGTGQYVMVRDVTISAGEGNWVFVPRSCLPATLPENESERNPPPPTVVAVSPSGVEARAAVLHGTVNPNGVHAKYHFDYGPTLSYGSSTLEGDAGSGTGSVEEGAAIAGLTPYMTYYYRIVATSATGTSYSSPVSFTTQPVPPTVNTELAQGVQEFAATLDGSVNPNGADTHYYFQYGKTAGYGSTTSSTDAGSGRNGIGVNVPVSSLQAGHTYHYRIVASNLAGTSYGADHTFTTTQTKRLVTALRENGEQYVWYRDAEQRLHFWYWNNVNWSENYLGSTGAMAGQPTSVLRENGEQYVWYRGTDGALHFWYWNDVKWSEGYLGSTGAMAGEPKAVIRTNGEQYVWYRGTDGVTGSL